jgi:hypothetical protein
MSTLGLTAVALALVPLTTSTGEQLEARLPESPLIARHAELADGLLPWVFGLFVVSVFVTWLDRRHPRRSTAMGQLSDPPPVEVSTTVGAGGRPLRAPATMPGQATGEGSRRTAASGGNPVALRLMATVLAVVAATGTVVQVVRIGDAGARAAWSDVPASPRPGAVEG